MPFGYSPDPAKLPVPEQRRVIWVLSGADIEQIRYDSRYRKTKSSIQEKGNRVWLMDNNIDAYKDEKTISFLKSLRGKNLLDEGTILVRDEYNDRNYFSVDRIEDECSIAKWLNYTTICNYLGAINVSLKVVRVRKFASTTTFASQMSDLFSTFGVTAKLSKAKEEKLNNSVNMRDIDKAKPDFAMVKKHLGFKEHDSDDVFSRIQDPDIKHLIEQRLNGKDLIYTREIELFTQVEQGMAVATSLSIPQQFTQLNAAIKRSIKESMNYSVSVTVEYKKDENASKN